MMADYKMSTKCVQAGYTPGNGEPRQIPIVQSTTFKYDTSEDMGKLFDLEASGWKALWNPFSAAQPQSQILKQQRLLNRRKRNRQFLIWSFWK